MKTIIVLLVLLVAVVTVTNIYMMKADREFLHFCDMVIDDNIKNVVESGGSTFYVVDMAEVDIKRPDVGVKFWGPVYVRDKDLDTVANWKRKMTLMVGDFENLDFDSKIRMAKVNQWFQQKLKEERGRKEKTK